MNESSIMLLAGPGSAYGGNEFRGKLDDKILRLIFLITCKRTLSTYRHALLFVVIVIQSQPLKRDLKFDTYSCATGKREFQLCMNEFICLQTVNKENIDGKRTCILVHFTGAVRKCKVCGRWKELFKVTICKVQVSYIFCSC